MAIWRLEFVSTVSTTNLVEKSDPKWSNFSVSRLVGLLVDCYQTTSASICQKILKMLTYRFGTSKRERKLNWLQSQIRSKSQLWNKNIYFYSEITTVKNQKSAKKKYFATLIQVHCLWSDTKMTLTMIERLNFESVIMHFRRK